MTKGLVTALKRLVPVAVKAGIKDMMPIKVPPVKPLESMDSCICCGSRSIVYAPILWEGLISAWGLSASETAYINRQQGLRCPRCKSNLRTMALAHGMMRKAGFTGAFRDFVRTSSIRNSRILEVNEAGQITQFLRTLRGHTLSKYPDVDIQKLPHRDSTFDVVLHSDTLEHVADPIAALRECCRVLKPEGYCVFTVPLVVDRISRSRLGLPVSHHGSEQQRGSDYVVFTEFGSDAWKFAIQAGFSEVRICSLEYPSAQSLLCTK
jgi:SAM-dependent methyltransferase